MASTVPVFTVTPGVSETLITEMAAPAVGEIVSLAVT
jgi:hypothetical protein